jgi:hypothetical protein
MRSYHIVATPCSGEVRTAREKASSVSVAAESKYLNSWEPRRRHTLVTVKHVASILMNSRRRALPFTVLSTSPAARTPAQQIYRYMRRVSKGRHLLSMNSIRSIQGTRLTEIDDEQSRMGDQDAPIRGYRVSRPQRTRVQRNESNRDMWGGSRNTWEGVVEGELVAGSGRERQEESGRDSLHIPTAWKLL